MFAWMWMDVCGWMFGCVFMCVLCGCVCLWVMCVMSVLWVLCVMSVGVVCYVVYVSVCMYVYGYGWIWMDMCMFFQCGVTRWSRTEVRRHQSDITQ